MVHNISLQWYSWLYSCNFSSAWIWVKSIEFGPIDMNMHQLLFIMIVFIQIVRYSTARFFGISIRNLVIYQKCHSIYRYDNFSPLFLKEEERGPLEFIMHFLLIWKKHLHNNNNEFIIDFDPKSNYLLSQAKFDWLIQHELSVKNQINSHWLWIARSISVKSATKLFIGHETHSIDWIFGHRHCCLRTS